MPTDIIHETLDALIEVLRRHGAHTSSSFRAELDGLVMASRVEAEAAVRKAWGGDTCYVGKTSADSLQRRSLRDRQILRDWQHGMHIPALARRYDLAERTIRHIVRLQAELPATVALSDCRDARQDGDDESIRDAAIEPARRRQPKAAARAA